MNKYAKAVLWIGFFLIAAQVVQNWSVVSAALFGSSQNPALKVPGPGGIPPNPATGKCPGPNYYFYKGRCYSAAGNLPPQKQPIA